MARKRSRLLDFCVYLVIRFVVCILQMLPYETCMGLADGLAWVAHKLDRRHRLVADENLRHAFPERTDASQRDRLILQVYQHFIGMAVTMLFLPRLFHATTWKRYMDVSHPQALIAAMLSGRPLLLVTGHFGNWELANYGLGMMGFPLASIARRLDNPYLHRYIESFRKRFGQSILDKSEDYEQMLALLTSGGALATLGDQDAGQRGLYVDFFGRPASTHKAMALMALEFRAPIVVLGVVKVGEPMRHWGQMEDIILPEEYDGRADAVRAITQRITSGIERLVRAYPEQYFWLHRRWKHQPAPRQRRVA